MRFPSIGHAMSGTVATLRRFPLALISGFVAFLTALDMIDSSQSKSAPRLLAVTAGGGSGGASPWTESRPWSLRTLAQPWWDGAGSRSSCRPGCWIWRPTRGQTLVSDNHPLARKHYLR